MVAPDAWGQLPWGQPGIVLAGAMDGAMVGCVSMWCRDAEYLEGDYIYSKEYKYDLIRREQDAADGKQEFVIRFEVRAGLTVEAHPLPLLCTHTMTLLPRLLWTWQHTPQVCNTPVAVFDSWHLQ